MCDCFVNCCHSLGLNVRTLLLLIVPSWLDLSSDILNALDMIFAGSWEYLCPEVFERFLNICSETNNYTNKAFQRKTCGYVSLSIVFMPGVVKATNVLAKCLKNKEYRKIPKVLIYLPYPLYIIFIQMKALCCPKSEKYQSSLVRALSMEAFYESLPQ